MDGDIGRWAKGQKPAFLLSSLFLQKRMKEKSSWEKRIIDHLLIWVGVGEGLHVSGLESQHEEWGISGEWSGLQPSNEPLAGGVGPKSSGEGLWPLKQVSDTEIIAGNQPRITELWTLVRCSSGPWGGPRASVGRPVTFGSGNTYFFM